MLEEQLEPLGTVPTVGDQVVCFGHSNYRKIGKAYKVVREDEYDVFTEGDADNEYAWEKLRFQKDEPQNQPYHGFMGISDNPRWYRVVKRQSPVAQR